MSETSSWPPDPADYEAYGFDHDATAADCDRLEAVLDRHSLRPARLLDLACGTARHARELARRGHDVVGVDRACNWLAHARALVDRDTPGRVRLVAGDLGRLPFGAGTFDLAFCLFNTLLEVVDNDQAIGLFEGLGRVVRPGGLVVIDNFCLELWAEVASGNYATGVSEDGEQQMIWEPGENAFVLRRGDEVRPDDWTISPGDRLYRLWSGRELALLARFGGFALVESEPDFVFRHG